MLKKYLGLGWAMAFAVCLAGFIPAQAAAAPVKAELVMGTAATSGTYYFVGAAVGDTVTEKTGKNLNVLVQSTAGGMENVTLISSHEIDIGMANSDALYDAYNGTGTFQAVGKMPIVGLMALYPSMSHMIVRNDSDIKSYADLKGKRVCLGTQGSSHPIASKALLAYYGVDWEKDLEDFYLTTDEIGTKLGDNDIDAGFLIGGIPLPGITNTAVTTPLRLLDLDQAAIDELIAKYPYFTQSMLPAGTYPGVDYDTKSVALTTNFFVNADMPEEVAYEFVKAAMENVANYVNTNASCAYILPETVWNMAIPLHPGAERYYREKGWMK